MITGRPWTETDLHQLATDRPLTTPELIESNDFYGHATILKAYAGLSTDYPLKTVIEHGVYIIGEEGWDVEWSCPLPMMLFPSTQRYGPLGQRTRKGLFAIGPLIHYAKILLDEHAFMAEKARIGRCLLVFPLHSSHWIRVDYDGVAHCRALSKIAGQFDTVRICMYWKDILDGKAKIYLEAGYECVTAGHMYDLLFLNRLKTLMALSDATASNELGTATGYSVAMGKPHIIHKTEAGYNSEHVAYKSELEFRRETAQRHSGKLLTDAFSEFNPQISVNQYELANRYWGLDQVRRPAKLRTLFRIAHDICLKGRSYYLSGDDVLTKHAFDCIKNGKHADACFLLDQAIRLHAPDRIFEYAKALACMGLQQYNDAAELLARFLEQLPDHGPANRLLGKLKSDPYNIIGTDDVVIASYPMAENGWVYRLVTDVIRQCNGQQTVTALATHRSTDIPVIQVDPGGQNDHRLKLPFRLIQSHNPHSPIPRRIIYLFDKAVDVCRANPLSKDSRSDIKEEDVFGPNQLFLSHLADWQHHLKTYLEAGRNDDQRILFVSCETLKRDPIAQLVRIFDFLDLNVSRSMCEHAVDNHNFENRSTHAVRCEDKKAVDHQHYIEGLAVGVNSADLRIDMLHYVEKKSDRLYWQAAALAKLKISLCEQRTSPAEPLMH